MKIGGKDMKLSDFNWDNILSKLSPISVGKPAYAMNQPLVMGMCGSSFSCGGGSGSCGSSFDCTGGGGVCGSSFDCAGSGGICGSSFDCSGGDGACSSSFDCSGS